MNKKATEPLFAEERKAKILELVKHHEKVTVAQLCNYFDVSSATIRNDLRELENSDLLRRTHGGAILKTKTGFEQNAQNKENQYTKEKIKIAETALGLIEDGDTIILDTGTTALELAKLLVKKKNLTVVVNDIEIARRLEEIDDISIVFIGGYVRKKYHCTVGAWGVKMISDLSVDKAFMGTNGISIRKGATTPDINQAEIKKAMLSIANKVIIICDSSKIGRSAFAQFAGPQQIDSVITDSGADKDVIHDFEKSGIEVIVAQG